jgi:hypothetical protein
MNWAVAGLILLILIIPVCLENLQEIYRSQKDFVIGVAFSAASFCFGRAYNRRTESEAVHLIQNRPTADVQRALDDYVYLWLARRGAFAEASVLARNLEAAGSRLIEFFDLQVEQADFHRTMPVLKVAIADVEKAVSNLGALHGAIDARFELPAMRMDRSVRTRLVSANRSLAAAADRRIRFDDWLRSTTPVDDVRVLPLLGVMTSDLFKAERGLEAILNSETGTALTDQLIVVHDFIEAALGRAGELQELIGVEKLKAVPIFAVMVGDLRNALDYLVAPGSSAPVVSPTPAVAAAPAD